MIETNDSFCDKYNDKGFREKMVCIINEYTGEDNKVLNDFFKNRKNFTKKIYGR